VKIQRYFPGFVDIGEEEPPIAEFSTVEELLSIPWVASWAKPISAGPQFDKYSLSGNALMAELKGPREWYVVGLFAEVYPLDLPKLDARWHVVT
jgi:hypothetical protein